jgi:hypothetical protein
VVPTTRCAQNDNVYLTEEKRNTKKMKAAGLTGHWAGK